MAASPVLVDSSFYITLARRGVDPLRALAATALERDLAVCGIVRCEVGRGIRVEPVWRKFQAFWDVMINVPTDNRLWSEAEKLVWELDRKGFRVPLQDVVIACCARRIDGPVLTFDRHFDLIPRLRVLDSLD
jgi:predicted nucleic acid-binding protein